MRQHRPIRVRARPGLHPYVVGGPKQTMHAEAAPTEIRGLHPEPGVETDGPQVRVAGATGVRDGAPSADPVRTAPDGAGPPIERRAR